MCVKQNRSSILMLGAFAPPITGESAANGVVLQILSKQNNVHTINTNIVSNVNEVGSFSLRKVLKQIKLYKESIAKIRTATVIYLTPGQTFLGIIRFIPFLMFSKFLRKNTIAHWHGYGVLGILSKSLVLRKFLPLLISKNIVLTEHIKTQLYENKIHLNNVIVIKNFIEDAFMLPSFNKTSKQLSFIFLSNLMPQKGIFEFVGLASAFPNYDFVVCGSGSDKIESKIKVLASTTPNLEYKGVVTGETKKELLIQADFFVLLSDYKTEGVPLSMLEAMGCGCVVISTEHNGIPETISCDKLLIKKDQEALIKKIYGITSNNKEIDRFKELMLQRAQLYSYANFENSILNQIR